MTGEQIKTNRTALSFYGNDNQIIIALEELAELQTSLLHYKRGKVSKLDVITEIADVKICLNQLQMIFGQVEVKKEIDKKMLRLFENIRKEAKCIKEQKR